MADRATSPAQRTQKSLAHLPIGLLAIPLGLGGLGLAWRHMAEDHAALRPVGEALMALTALVWAALVTLHAIRALAHPHATREDWQHPFRASFVGAASIGMMLTAAALTPHLPSLARAVLLLAVILHLGIGLSLLARVMRGAGSPAMLAPPLMIPLVGNVLAPIFCAPLGLVPLGWILFGIGMLLWLGLQPLLYARLFEGPLPPAMRPSLAILIAPPAVGALAIDALGGPPQAVWALYGLAAFVFALVLMALRSMLEGGFGLGFWAFTFPLAAFSIITMKLGPGWIGGAMLALTTIVIGLIAARTAILAARGAYLRAT